MAGAVVAQATKIQRRVMWGAIAVVIWASLTVATAIIHDHVWLQQSDMGDDGGARGASAALVVLSNATHMMTSPAWVLHRGLTGRWGVTEFPWLLAVDGAGWALWGLAAVLAVRARARMVRHSAAGAAGECPGLSRRRFLVDGSLAVAGVGAAGLAVRTASMDPWSLRIASYSIPIRGLPAALDGLRLIQISDTHLGPRVPASYIRDAVQLALSRRPDVVLLTGDYVHNGPRFVHPAAALFAPLIAAGVPTVGVLGNHDTYAGARAVRAALSGVGVRMIDNGRVFLDAASRRLTERGEPGMSLCLAGLGDLTTDFISVHLALGGVDESIPRLVLAHNPDTAEAPQCTGDGRRPGPRIDLMLSGHTHGGQVRLPLIGTPLVPSRYGQKYAGGLVQGPAFPVLVSRGVGMSLVPVRFGVPPELVEVVLGIAPRR